MRHRDLGEMGQAVLQKWAASVGITANRAVVDQKGWDYILEFPSSLEEAPPLPLDMRRSEIACLLQVKSTDGSSTRCRIKLSNWERMVKHPLPTFVLFLKFDGMDRPVDAYLTPIGEDLILRVLKRLRFLPHDAADALHKEKMQFTCRPEDRLDTLDGSGLEKAIRAHVGQDFHGYIETKRRYLKEVGFEEGAVRGRVTFSVPPEYRANPDELEVDVALGLVPRIEVIKMVMQDVRFGIPSSDPPKVIHGGYMEIGPPQSAGTSTVTIETIDGKDILSFDTETFFPTWVVHIVDKRSFKVRLSRLGLDVIITMAKREAEFRFKFPGMAETHELAELYPLARFLLLFRKAEETGDTIRVTIEHKDASPLHFEQPSPRTDVGAVDLARVIDAAWTIAKFVDIHDRVEVKLGDLLKHAERLKMFSLILDPGAVPPVTMYNPDPVPFENETVGFPYTASAPLGQFKVVVGFALTGRVASTGNVDQRGHEYDIQGARVTVLRKHVLKRTEPIPFSRADLVKEVEEYLDGQSIPCVVEKPEE